MKTRYKIPIIATSALIMVAIFATTIISYQQTYDENCIATDGKITGFLQCMKVHRDYATIQDANNAQITENLQKISLKYDIDTDDIITRQIHLSSQIATQKIPQRTCHSIKPLEEKYLPESLKTVINDSLVDHTERHRDHDNDGFLDKHGTYISLYDATYLLQKYGFDMELQYGEFGFPKQNDTEYVFECIVDYDSNQYKITITFQTHFDLVGSLVFVNFTKNDSGYPILEGDHLTLFTGGFNQTLVFSNKLEHPVTISIENRTQFDPILRISQSMTIPAEKVWSYAFRSHFAETTILQFNEAPDNLSGTIILKRYPSCMTQDELVSIYSQVGAYPAFPTYIPEGYSYQCGMHNMNGFVHMTYWNDEHRSIFEDKRNDGLSKEFFAKDGIAIDYYNHYIINEWREDPQYDKNENAKRDNMDRPDSKKIMINGEPAVLTKKNFWKDGEQSSYNELQIYLDKYITYRVRSGLSEEQVIRIAESLFE